MLHEKGKRGVDSSRVLEDKLDGLFPGAMCGLRSRQFEYLETTPERESQKKGVSCVSCQDEDANNNLNKVGVLKG